MPTIDKVNLSEKLAQFSEHWKPKIVGEVNESFVKLVKFKGEFVWHHHENEDEMFLVVQGRLRMKTGNLDDVSALAGYVNAASGRTYIAVILLNHPGVEHGPGEAVQAALIEWLFAQ